MEWAPLPPCLPVHYPAQEEKIWAWSGRREKSFRVQIAGGPAAAIWASLFSGFLPLSKGIGWNFRLIFRRVKAPQSAGRKKKNSKCQVEDMKLLLNKSLVMQLTRKQKISLIKLAVAEFMKMLRWQTRWVQHDQLMITIMITSASAAVAFFCAL